jgi:8-oxo-dGTP pyrophosphatase MutT (NUDIX family)
MDIFAFKDRVAKRLQQPLPGLPAQLSMAHFLRVEEITRFAAKDLEYRDAGVAILIFPDPTDVLRVALIKRTAHPRDVHSGQVSFPGGRIESHESILEGTLRELHEEVGVTADQVEVLGRLTELQIPVSKFLVHPLIVFTSAPPNFSHQPDEVEQILTPKLDWLIDSNNVQYKDITVYGGYLLHDVPYLEIEGHTVWGATAMMLGELRALLEEI